MAESECDAAQENVRELQALIRFLRRQIEQNSASTLPLALDFQAQSGELDYSKMIIPDAMADVLRKAGGPLHVKAITERIVAGGRTANTKTLSASVFSAAVRHTDRFVQTGRATFALKEFIEEQRRPAV